MANATNDIPEPLRRAHALSLLALARVDAAARVRLHADARAPLRHLGGVAPDKAIPAFMATAAAMEEQVAAGVVLVRSAARGASAATLADEVTAAGVAVVRPDPDETEDDLDEAAGEVAGKSTSAWWLALVLLLLSRRRDAGARVDVAEIGAAALAENAWRLDALATTEAAVAFNRERAASLAAYVDSGLCKRWDATLDGRVCTRCKALDGIIAPIDGSFPGGVEPGAIHRRCRCICTILPAKLVTNDHSLRLRF